MPRSPFTRTRFALPGDTFTTRKKTVSSTKRCTTCVVSTSSSNTVWYAMLLLSDAASESEASWRTSRSKEDSVRKPSFYFQDTYMHCIYIRTHTYVTHIHSVIHLVTHDCAIHACITNISLLMGTEKNILPPSARNERTNCDIYLSSNSCTPACCIINRASTPVPEFVLEVVESFQKSGEKVFSSSF